MQCICQLYCLSFKDHGNLDSGSCGSLCFSNKLQCRNDLQAAILLKLKQDAISWCRPLLSAFPNTVWPLLWEQQANWLQWTAQCWLRQSEEGSPALSYLQFCLLLKGLNVLDAVCLADSACWINIACSMVNLFSRDMPWYQGDSKFSRVGLRLQLIGERALEAFLNICCLKFTESAQQPHVFAHIQLWLLLRCCFQKYFKSVSDWLLLTV